MTRLPNSKARKIGFLLIGASLAVGLPQTASRAINYVDKVKPAALAPAHHMATVAPGSMMTALAPVAAATPVPVPAALPRENGDGTVTVTNGVTMGRGDVAFYSDDRIIMNGKVKRVDEMTAAERAQLRTIIEKSKRDIAKERAELPARLAEARREIDRIKSGEMERELQQNLKDLKADLARVDSEAAELRRAGQDPEKVKAEIRHALHEAETEGLDGLREARQELADFDPDKIVAEVREAEDQMARLQARLDQLDRR